MTLNPPRLTKPQDLIGKTPVAIVDVGDEWHVRFDDGSYAWFAARSDTGSRGTLSLETAPPLLHMLEHLGFVTHEEREAAEELDRLQAEAWQAARRMAHRNDPEWATYQRLHLKFGGAKP